jgi:hypothetical protein
VEVAEIKKLIWIQIGLEFRKDLKIKKLFPIFYWPWAEFLPTGPAEPTPASLACGLGAAQHRSSPTPLRIATESEAPSTEISTKPVKNWILKLEPYRRMSCVGVPPTRRWCSTFCAAPIWPNLAVSRPLKHSPTVTEGWSLNPTTAWFRGRPPWLVPRTPPIP